MRIGSERYGKEVCERRLEDWWFDSARRAEGGGGFKGYRLCRRPLWKGRCVDWLLFCELLELVNLVNL